MELNDLNLKEYVSYGAHKYLVSTVLLADGSGYETVIYVVEDRNDPKRHSSNIAARQGYAAEKRASLGHRTAALGLASGIQPRDLELSFMADTPNTKPVSLEPSEETQKTAERLIEEIRTETLANGGAFAVGDRVCVSLDGVPLKRGTISYVSPPTPKGVRLFGIVCDDKSTMICGTHNLRLIRPDKPN
jgi:hypothetical protein